MLECKGFEKVSILWGKPLYLNFTKSSNDHGCLMWEIPIDAQLFDINPVVS
jgi:hypothetical protein